MFETEDDVLGFNWDLRLEGRKWDLAVVRARYDLAPEKIELIEGKLFCAEEQRLAMIALLLENVGVQKAVRLGDPAVWRKAVQNLDQTA